MITAQRLPQNPIIRPHMDRRMGGNINGPSLIRTPEWMAGRLGRYHLYFAHHLGSYIRLAYSDRLEGPWSIHGPGVLDVGACLPFYEHVASPDMHIDAERREIRMYVHGITSPDPWEDPEQSTCLAQSFDGLNFALRPAILGRSYFRVWTWAGMSYALSVRGMLWRSPNGTEPFTPGPRLRGLPEMTRHVAVMLRGRRLWLAWSVIGDCPERIFIGSVEMGPDWSSWQVDNTQELLRPEADWEGAQLHQEPSRSGAIIDPAHQLRDPAFFREDGQDYLIYACAGEAGLAIAKLNGMGEGH